MTWLFGGDPNFEEVFGAVSVKQSAAFYEALEGKSKAYYLDISPELTDPFAVDADIDTLFGFYGKLIKQPTYWIMATHVEKDTALIVTKDAGKVYFARIDYGETDGEFTLISENFNELLTLMTPVV